MENSPEIKLHGNDKENGWIGVALVAGTVFAWDISDNQTITNWVERQVHHEDWRRKALAIGSLAYLGLHLTDSLDTRLDPIDHIARGVEAVGSKIGQWATRGVRSP